METYQPGMHPGILTPPKAFEYIPNINFGAPVLDNAANTYLWPTTNPSSRSKSKKRSKKSPKHRSKSHKQHTEHNIGAYILQIIGVLCLIIAAIRCFEPLTGVGFTLILIGYNQGLKKTEIPGLVRESEERSKRHRSSSKRVKKRKEEHNDTDPESSPTT